MAVAAWQLLALRRKDTKFQRDISQAGTVLDKFKVAFQWLFNFNKEIVEDIKSQDLNTTVTETSEKIKTEYASLVEKAEWLKSEYAHLTKEEWISRIDELMKKNNWLIGTAKEYVNKVLENPDVQALKEKANSAINDLKTLANETKSKDNT